MWRVFPFVLFLPFVACEQPQPATCDDGCAWEPLSDDVSGCTPAALSATGLPAATVPLEGDITLFQHLTYRQAGGVALQGDLFVPDAVDPNAGPLIVVHGGGWEDCGRRRDVVTDTAYGLAAILDAPVFNIEYRLRQEGGGYPNNLSDVVCAVQWISDQSDLYGFSNARVALIGESAGAHLALLTAMTGDRSHIDPDCGDMPDINAVVAVSPPVDLVGLYADGGGLADTVGNYTEDDCQTDIVCPEVDRECGRCEDASPMRHVGRGDAELVLVQAPDPFDPLLAAGPMQAFTLAHTEAGGQARIILPSESALAAEGCPAGTPVHGFTPCLISATGTQFIPTLTRALRPTP